MTSLLRGPYSLTLKDDAAGPAAAPAAPPPNETDQLGRSCGCQRQRMNRRHEPHTKVFYFNIEILGVSDIEIPNFNI